jgi:Holliday junction resolvase RusA-like endonuclease
MAMNISFQIPISPRGKERPRISTRGGFPRNYNSKKQNIYENKMAALIMQHRPEKPSENAIMIDIIAYIQVPKTKLKKWQKYHTPCLTKPDLDNIYKNITDLMNGVFYIDDKQIIRAIIEKKYSDNPRWEINIWDE